MTRGARLIKHGTVLSIDEPVWVRAGKDDAE